MAAFASKLSTPWVIITMFKSVFVTSMSLMWPSESKVITMSSVPNAVKGSHPLGGTRALATISR